MTSLATVFSSLNQTTANISVLRAELQAAEQQRVAYETVSRTLNTKLNRDLAGLEAEKVAVTAASSKELIGLAKARDRDETARKAASERISNDARLMQQVPEMKAAIEADNAYEVAKKVLQTAEKELGSEKERALAAAGVVVRGKKGAQETLKTVKAALDKDPVDFEAIGKIEKIGEKLVGVITPIIQDNINAVQAAKNDLQSKYESLKTAKTTFETILLAPTKSGDGNFDKDSRGRLTALGAAQQTIGAAYTKAKESKAAHDKARQSAADKITEIDARIAAIKTNMDPRQSMADGSVSDSDKSKSETERLNAALADNGLNHIRINPSWHRKI